MREQNNHRDISLRADRSDNRDHIPYVKLWSTVLVYGIRDYVTCRRKAIDSEQDAYEFKLINDWLLSESDEVSTFNWICTVCGMNPDRIRELTLKQWQELDDEFDARRITAMASNLKRKELDVKDSASKKAYDTKYESSADQVKRREARNKARAALVKAGVVQKGDGKDVDHKIPLDRGGSNKPANWDVKTEAANRGWRKGKSGYNP